VVNKADLEQLANDRIADAGVLLAGGRWSGAYYLAGYAVECALKACIAKLTRAEDFPDQKFANKVWTHDLETLVKAAGLEEALRIEVAANANLLFNWGIAKDWTEKSRYEQIEETEARALYNAITDPNDGVLAWIHSHW
jgi:HEPN domain-containing protein